MTTVTQDNNPINIYTNEPTEWAIGTTLTLMNYTGSPGVVEAIQFFEDGRNFNATLTVQIDDYPVITCSAPTFFGFILDPISSTQATLEDPSSLNTAIIGGINNKNYVSSNVGGWGCTKRVFIPFTLNITITVSNNNDAATASSQVTYRKWPAAFPLYYSVGERRKYWKVLQVGSWTSPISIAPLQTTYYNLPTITGRGQIEFITHVLWGVNPSVSGDPDCQPITCLEGSYIMNIDGNLSPPPLIPNYNWLADTYWGGHHYWSHGKTVANGPDCGLFTWCGGQGWQGAFNMQAYKFCYDKTIFFDSSFILGWKYGNSNYSKFGQGVTNCNNIFLISYWTEDR